MLSASIDRIQINQPTQLLLHTSWNNWIQSTPQSPVFAVPALMSIPAQEILDDHTALLTLIPTTANSLVTIVDPMNNEGVTFKCWDTPQFNAMGQYPQTLDLVPVNESNNPINDGYWDSTDDEQGYF